MMQIQITEIDNGWLVGTPPQMNKITQQQTDPHVIYCEDYSAVCQALKQFWPKE